MCWEFSAQQHNDAALFWGDVLLLLLSCCHVPLFEIPWTAAYQASLSVTISLSLLKLMFIELVMPSNHLILCRPLLLLPSIFPSNRVFSNELVLRIRWPNYRSFSFNISSSSEYVGLISLRTDWFDLLVVQEILKSLLQHHSSKASNLWCSTLFTVQLPPLWNTYTFSGTHELLYRHNLI